MSGTAAAPVRAGQPDPVLPLTIVVALCWAATLGLLLGGGHDAAHHGVALDGAGAAAPGRLAGFAVVWLVMIGAMMLPTVAPLVRMFAAVSASAPRPGAARLGLYLGYLAVWAAFAPIALLGDAGVHVLVAGWEWLAARPGLVLGATLVLAGAYQFSPWKNACLTACRNPMAFLWQHYRRGVRGGWAVGARHGLSCLGCCWALMLVMFATGVGSLAWMLVLTGVMVVEKTSRRGVRLVAPVGVALLVAGAAVSATAVIGG
jgi:predicted metal-binding membrane protein